MLAARAEKRTSSRVGTVSVVAHKLAVDWSMVTGVNKPGSGC